MEFDTADLARLEANGSLYYTVLHEMAHILGFGTIWEDRGLLSGAGTSNPLFVGRLATAVYASVFGTSAAGVPVENGGGSGTRDSHWRESVFGNEVMTGYLASGFNPLSRVTLASLIDLGYTVNLSAADGYTPPGGAAIVQGGTSGGTRTALRAAALLVPAVAPERHATTGRAVRREPVAWRRHADADWFEHLAARVAAIPAGPSSDPLAVGRSRSSTRSTSCPISPDRHAG